MAAPRKHPPQNAAETIQSLAASGHSQLGIAAHFKVVVSTFKRWLDESEALQNAYDLGKETERQELHALVVRSARENKPANVNAFFILKARHGYVEADRTSNQVNVAMQVNSVMVVKDHGTDEEWEAKAAAQQRKLISSSVHTVDAKLQIAPPSEVAQPVLSAPSFDPPKIPFYEPPAWKPNA